MKVKNNLNIKTGKRIFNKIRSELNFENTEKAEEIEAIKSLTKTEIKIDKMLDKMSDKFTPLHFKAAYIIIGYYRRYKRYKKVERTNSLRHLLEDKIHKFEDKVDGFRKDRKGDRFVEVVLNSTKKELKHSKITRLLKGSLTIIEEDYHSKKNDSSDFDYEKSSMEHDNVKRNSYYLQKPPINLSAIHNVRGNRLSKTNTLAPPSFSSKMKVVSDHGPESILSKQKSKDSHNLDTAWGPSKFMKMKDDRNSFVSNSVNLESALTPTDHKISNASENPMFDESNEYDNYLNYKPISRKKKKVVSNINKATVLKVEQDTSPIRKYSQQDKDIEKQFNFNDSKTPEENSIKMRSDKIKPFDYEITDNRQHPNLPSLDSSSDCTEEQKKSVDKTISGHNSKINEEIDEELEDVVETTSNKQIGKKEFKIEATEAKRAVTAGIPIRNFAKLNQLKNNVFKPTTPKRDGFETARTARKMTNQGNLFIVEETINLFCKDTQRQILGNVWINDMTHKEANEQNQSNLIKQTSLGKLN